VSLGPTEELEGWNSEESSNPMERETSSGEVMYTSVEQLHGICADNHLDAEAFVFAVREYDAAKHRLLEIGYGEAMVQKGLNSYLLGNSDGNIITL